MRGLATPSSPRSPLERGIEVVLTSDRAFDEVGGLVRAVPADAQAVSTLAG
ncbi:MAG: hypothetical protein WKF96_17275 [Solirubrobacteraceae bacterium]